MNNIFRIYNYKMVNGQHFSLRLFGVIVIAFLYQHRFGWVRILGRGFSFKDTKVYGKTFSERNGLAKRVNIKNWSFSLL